jgi:hypothetical protein
MAYLSVVQFDFCNKSHIKRGSMLVACIAGCPPTPPKKCIYNVDLGVVPKS